MTKKLIALLIITLTPVPAVQGAESLYSQVYEHCMETSEGINSNMRDCIEAERVRLDKELNSAYKELMKLLDKDSQEKLRQAQHSWLKYRELNGVYIWGSRDGTMASLIANSWMLEELAERVQFLRDERAALE